MFDKEKLSADEWQFIRLYCRSVQKHYDVIDTIQWISHPDNLAVVCPVAATRLAVKLEQLQKEQCGKLESLVAKLRRVPPEPSLSDIADIFALSFFKLVDGNTKKVFITDKNLPTHDGWSSGHPADWQRALKSLQEIQQTIKTEPDAPASLFLAALLKLFSGNHTQKNTNWHKTDYGQAADYDDGDWEDEYDDDDNDPLSFFM